MVEILETGKVACQLSEPTVALMRVVALLLEVWAFAFCFLAFFVNHWRSFQNHAPYFLGNFFFEEVGRRGGNPIFAWKKWVVWGVVTCI